MESGSSRKSADFRWTGSFPSAGGAGVSTRTLGKPPSAASPRRHGMSLPQAGGVGVTSTILRPSENPCNRCQGFLYDHFQLSKWLIQLQNITVPTVPRSGPCRACFYRHEPNEPPHIHIDRDEKSARFWRRPVPVAQNSGFSTAELRRGQSIREEHQQAILEAWDEHFDP